MYSKSGVIVGRIHDNKVHGPDGRYIGTIVSDRLVYRSSDGRTIRGSFSVANRAGSGMGNMAGSSVAGDEPNIPD